MNRLAVYPGDGFPIFRLDTPFLVSLSFVIKFVYIFFFFNWPISEVVYMTQKSVILF